MKKSHRVSLLILGIAGLLSFAIWRGIATFQSDSDPVLRFERFQQSYVGRRAIFSIENNTNRPYWFVGSENQPATYVQTQVDGPWDPPYSTDDYLNRTVGGWILQPGERLEFATFRSIDINELKAPFRIGIGTERGISDFERSLPRWVQRQIPHRSRKERSLFLWSETLTP